MTATLLNDPRDRPFLMLIAASSAVVLPFAGALYVPGIFRWWLAVVYLAILCGVFLDRFILMLHNTSHRPLFRKRWRLLNLYIPWVLGPFFGETPETYFAHHVGMHHPENNLAEDLSSTMGYQRDSALDFLRYFGRFMAFCLPDLARYLTRTHRSKLRNRMLLGELTFYAVVAGLLFVNWRATLVVFVIPFLLVRFLMMAGNWGQHAFIDAATPEVAYRNSITVLAGRYNRRCFNDGYHIGHHLSATRHWTEMPGDFEANRATYARERALVFDVDFFAVWLLLMLRRYGSLARHLVTLEGPRPSEADLVTLLRERTRALSIARS
ncbi:MAG: fatty acid desaturase family protein [Myxococcales bacterium]